jgi:alkanesulfonate monooxygenase SsuD/methylene tetrahydromethanopterin reductase-like flavin-dependent oxidoreductase (luciferase family)
MASPDDFPEEVASLLAFLGEHDPPRAAFAASVVAIPAVETSPVVFVLGSSDFGGALAAKMGLGFAFAHQINPADAVRVMRAYKRDFVPSHLWPAPHGILAVSAFAAESVAEVEDAAQWARLASLRFAEGKRDLPMPTIVEARGRTPSQQESSTVPLARSIAHTGRLSG